MEPIQVYSSYPHYARQWDGSDIEAAEIIKWAETAGAHATLVANPDGPMIKVRNLLNEEPDVPQEVRLRTTDWIILRGYYFLHANTQAFAHRYFR